MFGILSSPTYATEIKRAISGQILFEQVGEFDGENFRRHCQAAGTVLINTLIIDMDCTTPEALVKGIRQFRILRPEARIILIAINRQPGDTTVSTLVGLGIYDIVSPELSEEEDLDLTPLLAKQLNFPGTYADAARWDYRFLSESGEVEKEKDGILNSLSRRRFFRSQSEVSENPITKEILQIQNKFVLVVNLTPRAGATFIGCHLAALIASKHIHCALIEHPYNRASLYDQLNVSARVENYISPMEQIQISGYLKKEHEFYHDGVQFLLNHPEIQTVNIPAEGIMRMVYQVKNTPVVIYDVSYHADDTTIFDLLPVFEHVFVVIDPDPVMIERLAPGNPEFNLFSKIESLRQEQGLQVHYVINKDNEGVDRKLLEECLPQKPLAYISHLDPAIVYQAAWKGRLLDTDMIESLFAPLLSKLLPKELISTKKKKWRLTFTK